MGCVGCTVSRSVMPLMCTRCQQPLRVPALLGLELVDGLGHEVVPTLLLIYLIGVLVDGILELADMLAHLLGEGDVVQVRAAHDAARLELLHHLAHLADLAVDESLDRLAFTWTFLVPLCSSPPAPPGW